MPRKLPQLRAELRHAGCYKIRHNKGSHEHWGHDIYSLVIEWDNRDNIFVVSSVEWPGNHTHGSTYEEALAAGRDMLTGLTEIAHNRGQVLPPVQQFSRTNHQR